MIWKWKWKRATQPTFNPSVALPFFRQFSRSFTLGATFQQILVPDPSRIALEIAISSAVALQDIRIADDIQRASGSEFSLPIQAPYWCIWQDFASRVTLGWSARDTIGANVIAVTEIRYAARN